MRSKARGSVVVWRSLSICLAFWLLLAGGLTGCGTMASRGSGASEAAVEHTMKAMLEDLEQGRYRAACESFSLRSRVGMAIASAQDGHESSSPCSDMFVVGGALSRLGLNGLAQKLQREADKAGMNAMVDLPIASVQMLYRGIEDARYGKQVIAVREGSRWVLEVVSAEVTARELATEMASACSRPRAVRFVGRKLCSLMQSVLDGRVLEGAEHREFVRLFPRMAEWPSHELQSFRQTHGNRK
jgi:hypothetical protein